MGIEKPILLRNNR